MKVILYYIALKSFIKNHLYFTNDNVFFSLKSYELIISTILIVLVVKSETKILKLAEKPFIKSCPTYYVCTNTLPSCVQITVSSINDICC